MGKNIIEVKNIKTGEVLEFTGQNAVAKYLTGVYGKKIYAGAVASAIRQDTPYKNTWEINFIKMLIKKYAIIVAKNIQVIEQIKDFAVILVEKNIVQKKKEDQR